MKIIFISLLISIPAFCQSNYLHTPENKKPFADYLFCEQDYLRAAEEYISLGETFLYDTILYKIAKSYSIIGDYENSLNYFSRIPQSSFFYDNSVKEIGKIYYLNENDASLDKLIGEQENSFYD